MEIGDLENIYYGGKRFLIIEKTNNKIDKIKFKKYFPLLIDRVLSKQINLNDESRRDYLVSFGQKIHSLFELITLYGVEDFSVSEINEVNSEGNLTVNINIQPKTSFEKIEMFVDIKSSNNSNIDE